MAVVVLLFTSMSSGTIIGLVILALFVVGVLAYIIKRFVCRRIDGENNAASSSGRHPGGSRGTPATYTTLPGNPTMTMGQLQDQCVVHAVL